MAKSPDEKQQELNYLLAQVFISDDAQQEWLHSPVPMFSNQKPIDLIREGKVDRVISVLAGLHSGAFS
jgi:uncharacterized protein (DUF2384 family)